MADTVRLVVEIPKEYYDDMKASNCWWSGLKKCVMNGIPLPKGHGRLIDADALKMDTKICGDRYLSETSLFVANKVIEQAPTIIEADKEAGE